MKLIDLLKVLDSRPVLTIYSKGSTIMGTKWEIIKSLTNKELKKKIRKIESPNNKLEVYLTNETKRTIKYNQK